MSRTGWYCLRGFCSYLNAALAQKAILDELQDMKKLLSPRGDDRSPVRDINATLSVADAFAIGDTKATLTLVEFTDYQ